MLSRTATLPSQYVTRVLLGDMITEYAVNGRAEVIVTFNTPDRQQAHDRFGILVLTPAAFLACFRRRGLGKGRRGSKQPDR
jgi:hypothetical protein